MEVAKLVKAGLVSKIQNPDDGRRVILRVTDKARRLLDTLSATQRPVNDTIFESLDARTFRTFADVMSSLVTGTEGALALLRFREEQEAVASKRSGGASCFFRSLTSRRSISIARRDVCFDRSRCARSLATGPPRSDG